MPGLTFLKHNKFDPKSVMPICLPSSENFTDENRRVISVGRGLIKEDKEVRKAGIVWTSLSKKTET